MTREAADERTCPLRRPQISRAKLPENFKAAKQEIAQRVENKYERAQWTDKAAGRGLRRTAKDETLLKDAMRLEADAVRQLGGVILRIPAAWGRKESGRWGRYLSAASTRRGWCL